MTTRSITLIAAAALIVLAGCASTPEPVEFSVVDRMYARYAELTTHELRRLADAQAGAEANALLIDRAALAQQSGQAPKK